MTVGCRSRPDAAGIRMCVLGSWIGNALYIVEDKLGDLVAAVQAPRPAYTAPLAGGAASGLARRPPSGERATAGDCHGSRCARHGRMRTDGCEICRADAGGRVLKLTLTGPAFEVMVTGEKCLEFRPLEEYGDRGEFAKAKPHNRGKLFQAVRERGRVVRHDYTRPRSYEFVTFYHAGSFDSARPNFTCTFVGTHLWPPGRFQRVQYSNGLALEFAHRVAVVQLGAIVHKSPGLC